MIESGVKCIKYVANSGSETFDSGLKIKGNVKESGVSIPCRVSIFDQLSGVILGATITNTDGDFEFSHLKPIRCFIVAHHPKVQYKAVIQDNVVPK